MEDGLLIDKEKSWDEVVIITSRMVIEKSCIDSFAEIAKTVVEATRKEKGCMEYELLQDFFHPEIFFFYEVYRDAEAQSFHSGRQYLKDFKELRKPMLRQPPELNIYRAIAQPLEKPLFNGLRFRPESQAGKQCSTLDA